MPDPSPHTLPHFVGSANVLGQTPLMSACTHGHAAVVQFLLDAVRGGRGEGEGERGGKRERGEGEGSCARAQRDRYQ